MRNEAPNVQDMYLELTQVLEGYGRPYEVIVVDDGSTDETFSLLSSLQADDPRLRIIRFRRNFGQTAAFAAGFSYARGSCIVTIDGDRQNDPRDIPGMVDELRRGPDIVAGWRKRRKDPFLSRRLPSQIANAVISFVTGVHLHDYGCSLKVFRADVVKSMRLYGEMHRFLPAIAAEQGVDIVEYEVNHRPRVAGSSKYGISRTIRVILDLMTVKFMSSYSTRPLQMFGGLGLTLGFAGVVICGYMAYLKIVYNPGIANRPLLLLGALLILSGGQLLLMGLLGEMQARTYHESQNKPIYAIREIRETLQPREVENRRSDRVWIS
jgi:glycosyltransferase involved in cell wall biosynthesis